MAVVRVTDSRSKGFSVRFLLSVMCTCRSTGLTLHSTLPQATHSRSYLVLRSKVVARFVCYIEAHLALGNEAYYSNRYQGLNRIFAFAVTFIFYICLIPLPLQKKTLIPSMRK